MSGRWILATGALLAAPAAAQGDGTIDAGSLADQFEYALVAGDYRVLPLTEDFTYTENGARLDPWDGMWRTATALEGVDPARFADAFTLDYRVEIDSPRSVVRVVEVEENGVRGVMAYRLLARDGAISSVEVLPIREEFGGDRGGTITLLQPMLAFTMDGGHVGPSDPQTVSASSTVADTVMRQRVAAYFAAYSGDPAILDGEKLGFSDDCVRFDNGQQATGVAGSDTMDPAQPEFLPYALGCGQQLASGFYSNFIPAQPTVHTDAERGLAIAFARLDQPGTVLSFTTPDSRTIAYPGPRGAVEGSDTSEQFDGRILTNMITPMSVNGVYIFKFDDEGAIRRIEAFYRGAPLGWDAVPDQDSR